MSIPKNHHFVPEWNLKQFVDEKGFLHIYDKSNGMWREQKPKKCMHRNKYYRQEAAKKFGKDPNLLERMMGSRVETNGKNAFNKLLQWGEDLTNDEWSEIVIYLAFQRIRVPRQADVAKDMLRKHILINGDREATKKVLDGDWELKIHDSFRFDYMRIALPHFHPYFLRMHWEIISPEASEFITTDSPVSFYNPSVLPPNEADLKLAGTVVFFPIRKDRLLLMRYKEILEGAQPLDVVEEQEHQGNVVSQRMIWPAEQVNRHNKLMIELSDKISVASSKEILENAIGHELPGH